MKTLLQKLIPRSRVEALRMLAIFVTLVSVARICASYHSLSITWDEPSHVACGMEWIDQGKYTFETLHPPVSRVAVALLPFISGIRSQGETNEWPEGNKIFYSGDHYWRTLTLARMGVLPFYLLAVFMLWTWSKKMFGDEIAFLAVLFFTLIPPILAHAGLATTDIPLTAAFITACYALWWWLQTPNRNRSIVLGIVIGLAIGTKFSFLPYFPPAAILIVVYEFFVMRKIKLTPVMLRKLGFGLGLAAFASFIALWACYQFSYGPLPNSTGASYPMPEFFDGLSVILGQNKFGRAIYFMGHAQKNHASIWFFPVALALKTPIAFLLLAIAGVALIFLQKSAFRTKAFLMSYELLPLLISASLLAVAMEGNINLGVRHVLPVYPFLAMLAALGARWLFRLPNAYGKTIFALLLTWMVVSSFSCGNDRLAYFNELAGSNPEHFLIVSDLDWGQDLVRLSDTLRAEHVQFVSLNYNGSEEISRVGLPRFEFLTAGKPPNAQWVAISMEPLHIFDGYNWLLHEQPFSKVGSSILLYHFSDADLARIRTMLSNAGGNSSPNAARNQSVAAQSPAADSFLDLSLAYYKAKRFDECIAAARKVIALNPNSEPAYNNICAANNELGNFDEARKAGEQAVRLQPDNQLAKNNLKWAVDQLNKK